MMSKIKHFRDAVDQELEISALRRQDKKFTNKNYLASEAKHPEFDKENNPQLQIL